jgi:streptomycin 6-kinase
LHHDNILYDHKLGWRAIDPKGVIGEAAYETGAMLRNPGANRAVYSDPRILDRRVSIMTERLDLDRKRILAWNFVQFVLSQIWMIQNGYDLSPGALQTIEIFAKQAEA